MTKEQIRKMATATSDWVGTALLVALAGVVALAFMSSHVRAAEVCETYEEVLADYATFKAISPTMPEPEPLVGGALLQAKLGAVAFGVPEASGASRGFRVPLGDGLYTYGLEVDGCMLPPFAGVNLPESGAPSGTMDSGINV